MRDLRKEFFETLENFEQTILEGGNKEKFKNELISIFKQNMKKSSIYEIRNNRGYFQRSINVHREIVEHLKIEKGSIVYFVYANKEILIKTNLTEFEKEILAQGKKEILDFIFSKDGIIVKKSKVIGDMITGKRYHKLAIPSYICDKLHITSDNSFTYDLLEDCVRINIEV